MKKETYISIPQPCHENWEAMTPQNKGRYCASCAKTIIDFSQMTDAQILNYLSQSKGRICGRFAQEQIERPLTAIKKEKKKIWWMAALMPLTLLMNKANGQSDANKRIFKDIGYAISEKAIGSVADYKEQPNDTLATSCNKIITGTVTDEKGIPIVGATVLLKSTNTATVTDASGNFKLSFTTTNIHAALIVSYVGYQTIEKSCSFDSSNQININMQFLKLTPMLSGEVVVGYVGAISVRHPVKKIDTIKTAVRKILQTNPFKVYPNPVMRGGAIHIEVKTEGHYSIQLLDMNSRLITHELFDAAKGAFLTSVTLPASATTGIYFIRLINDDTKQQYTDKIIVE